MFRLENDDQFPDFRGFIDEFDILQTEIWCDTAPKDFRVAISEDTDAKLFRVDREQGVSVSTYQSDGICVYAGIDRNEYFRLCTLLGKIQWTALRLNPLLVEEDFRHESPSRCLFALQPFKQDYALSVEDPQVCQGCVDFYRCLGVETEILALCALLTELRATRQ